MRKRSGLARCVTCPDHGTPPLQALAAGQIYVRTADKLVVIGKTYGNKLSLSEAISGKAAGSAHAGERLGAVQFDDAIAGLDPVIVGNGDIFGHEP